MAFDADTTLVGETLRTLDDGTKELTMRNGMVYTFTPEEWSEYNAGFMESAEPSDLIDLIISKVSGRQIVPSSEVVDALLDLRNRCVEVENGLKAAVKMWLAAKKENTNES